MSYSYLIQGNNITLVIEGQSFTINKSHFNYEQIVQAIKDRDWDSVKSLVDPVKSVIEYGKGNVGIKGDQIYWKDYKFANALADKLFQMYQEGFPIEPLVLFIDNLMENPSRRAVTELYSFLEKGKLPITSDGHFLAYKKVKDDYTDCYTGTIDNSVGQVVEMERNRVDDDKDRTCSYGLHFCSKDYLDHFRGERVVVVKINPRDVVSIPSDYSSTKGRTCRYEVVEEITDQLNGSLTKAVQDF